MKKNITLLAFALLAIAVIPACTKKSSSTTNNSSPYTMTATKGGSNVSVSGQSSVYAVVAGPLLEVVGESISGNDTTGFVFMLGSYTGPGSYTLDGMTNVGEYVNKTGSTGTIIIATSGNVTITSAATPYMKGTFNFSDGTTSISNGAFTAHF